MTVPRQVFAGSTYLITRRCSERRFFLKPSTKTSAIFLYVLAVYAQRHGIQVHGYCVLSNHYHLVVTDPRGTLPDFQRDLDSVLARAINCSLGRWEAFWERDSYSAVKLVGAHDVLRKLVYVLTNPVAAGLVRHGREWPGLWSDPRRIGGQRLLAARPKVFFSEDGQMPQVAELRLCAPRPFARDPAFIDQLLTALGEEEESAAASLGQEGRSFLGAARVLAQSAGARPAPGEPRRERNPTIACRAKWKRIETLQRLVAFRRAYREALVAWRNGMRDVLFPPGTWHMRVQHAACCGSYG
jgi:REP element-mobilizing transposase RayT